MRACPNRGFKSRRMRPCPTRPHLQNTDSKTKGRTGVESASGLSSLSGKSRNTDFYVKVDFEILATNNLLLFFTKILPKKCLWAQFAQRPPVCRPGCEGCFSHFAPAAAELSTGRGQGGLFICTPSTCYRPTWVFEKHLVKCMNESHFENGRANQIVLLIIASTYQELPMCALHIPCR